MIFLWFLNKDKNRVRSKKKKNAKGWKDEIRTRDPILAILCTLSSLPNEISRVFVRKCNENQYDKK
jgi:hypothetical protein